MFKGFAAPAANAPSWRRWLKAWPGARRARAIFLGAYGLAAAVTALAIWLVAAAPSSGSLAPTSWAVLIVLGLNLLLILALASIVGLRVLQLARERQADAGARLHLRFVTLFSLVAVIPAVLVAVVFGVLVNVGVESWFSQRVRMAVENSASIALAYLDQEKAYVESEAPAMTADLAGVRRLWEQRLTFSRALQELGAFRGFTALYVIDSNGQVLARGEAAEAPPYLTPPAQTMRAAQNGEIPVSVLEAPDAVRAVIRLEDYGDAYLYGVRLLAPGMVQRLRDAEQSIVSYREAESNRDRIQAAFALSYVETALLVLVGAVWLGMSAATAISAPVGRLVQAANRVATGDLTARVDSRTDIEEIAVLSRSFNRMTDDLQTQQEALKAASAEAQGRRRFIETVLSGVSAGVVGLDAKGRVSALNRQAARLLGVEEAAALGKPLAKVAPEFAHVTSSAGHGDAEEEVDVTRGSEARRLRVRVSGGQGGERVLTFDDITRLVTAQRNAAWRDVARRIAHEIKNPLTPIQLSAERLRRKYRGQITGDLETFDRCTDTIVRQVGDIGRMVDEFSAFARMPVPKFSREDPAELLRQAVFAQRVAQPEAQVELVEPDAEVSLVCDARMVGQALTNVLKNAGEAVAARKLQDADSPGRIRARMVLEEDALTFIVEDDGVGLPSKDRDRLTEPYVTTRDKGTGLGLAIVKRILEDHGGELALADAVELTGARVTLSFPRGRAVESNDMRTTA